MGLPNFLPSLSFTSLWASMLAFVVLSIVFPFLRRRPLNVKGKHVLVTGASTGLGFALADAFVKRGANVSILSKHPGRLAEARDKLLAARSDSSQRVVGVQCDVTQLSEVNRAVKDAIEQLGAPTLVLPAAGLALPGWFADVTIDDHRAQMELNYFGSLYIVKACLPSMIAAKGGNVCFVSSAMALLGFAGYSMYAPTKYALRGLADSLRNELIRYNIKVHMFYPASMNTPGFAEEEKRKPKECRDIEGSASIFTAKDSAEHYIAGIERGHYQTTSPDPGLWILRAAGNGVAPRNNSMLEFLLLPIGFVAQAGFRMWADHVVRKKR